MSNINRRTAANVGLLTVLASTFVSSFAQAQADYSAITGAVDFDAAAIAIGTVIGAAAVMYVIWKGGKMVLGAIK